MNFLGKVLYANGVPAEGVRVRVFDKDAPGKRDDNLTTSQGISDNDGNFTVSYEPSKYLDYSTFTTTEPRNPPFDWTPVTRTRRVPDITDVYRPYLEFRYTYNNQSRRRTVSMNPFTTEFKLPEAYTTDTTFKPSEHGFKFLNSFSGFPLPFSVPSIPNLPPVDSAYGLCGGMAAAACDFYLAGKSIPSTTNQPAKNTDLYQYLYKRLVDTFGAFGENIVKMGTWMSLPDDTLFGIQKATLDEFESIRSLLDDGRPVVLGLVRLSTHNTLEIWKNHQVLAYDYSESSTGAISINIYDPNHPKKDDVIIKATRVAVGTIFLPGFPPRVRTVFGLSCTQSSGEPVRGFFSMSYVLVVPPAGL